MNYSPLRYPCGKNKIMGKEVLFFSKDLKINNPFNVKQLNFF